MNETTSLANLNDIVMPAPVAWWPPAPGWYVLGALLLVALACLGLRGWRSWAQNRYRRAALSELQAIKEQRRAQRLQELPALLKRTALSRWPREQVASLTGEDWHRFLDETAGTTLFTGAAGQTLDLLAYADRSRPDLGASEIGAVIGAVDYWLRHHRMLDREAS